MSHLDHIDGNALGNTHWYFDCTQCNTEMFPQYNPYTEQMYEV